VLSGMLAPAVGTLVGAVVVALWDDYRSPGRRGGLLPLTLLGIASLQLYILSFYPDWSHWLAPTILILCLAAAASLIVARQTPRLRISGYSLVAISIGVVSLFFAPSVWAASTIWYGAETRSPIAGPQTGPVRCLAGLVAMGTRLLPW